MKERSAGPARPKPLSAAYLDRAAIAYLQRFASSSENLRRVLLRKARRRLLPDEPPGPDVEALVAATVERALRSGLLDDRSYAEAKTASLLRRGTSPRAVRARLRQRGVPDEAVDAALAADPPDEVALARRLAQRRRLGRWRTADRHASPEKDVASLCRAGFSYAVARAALREEE